MKYLLIIVLILIFSLAGFHKSISISNKHLVSDELTTKTDSLVLVDTKIRSSKPHGKGWMKAYSGGIRFDHKNKWNKTKND